MKKIIYILKNDITKLIRNPASLIVIGALLVLPSLYAWFNIWASWDPYASTEGIKIAVSSEDKGTDIEGKEVNIGDEVITSLADNDELGWRFMDKNKALKGVKHGDYYAAIVIPEDFSENLGSVLEDDIKKPQMDYYINEKVNAIAPKVTSKGASAVVDNIKKSFVEESNKAVLTVFDDLGIELGDNYGDIEKIRDGIFELEENMPEIYAKIQKVEDGLDLADTATDEIDQSLDTVDDMHERAKKLNKDLINRLDKNKTSANDAIDSVTKHLKSAQESFREVPELTDKAADHEEDMDQLISNLKGKQDDLDSASERLQDIADFLENADKQIKSSTKIKDIQKRLDSNESDLESLKKDLNKIIKSLEDGNHPAVEKIDSISKRLDKTADEIDSLFNDYNDNVQPQLDAVLDDFRSLNDDIDAFFTRATERNEDALNTVKELRKNIDDLHTDEVKSSLDNISDHLDTNLDRIDSIIRLLETAENVTNSKSIKGLMDAFTQLKENIENSKSMIDVVISSIEKGEEVSKGAFDDLEQSLESVGKGIDHAQKKFNDKTKKALEQSEQTLQDLDKRMNDRFDSLQDFHENLDDSLNELKDAAENPKIALGTLKKAVKGTDTAIDAINGIDDSLGNVQKVIDTADISKEAKGIHSIQDRLQDSKTSLGRVINRIDDAKADGADALDRVDKQAARMDDSLEDMIGFVNGDLKDRYNQAIDDASYALNNVSDVLDDINSKVPKVRSVLEKIDDGLAEGKEKAELIDEKFPDAQDAIDKAANKIRDLEKEGNLDELIDFLRNDPQRISEFIGEPVQLDEKPLYPVPNYGSAMNPFYTTLSMWVGGLLLVSSLRVDRLDKMMYPSYAVYLGRLITFSFIGIIQGLIATLGNLFILDAYVAHPFYYVLFGTLIGFVFVSIIYTLVSVFGNVGKVLAIVLLVMQIGGSGGTYPIQMSPPFFQKIHAFLPFTQGIDLLRESVGGIIWEVAWAKIIYLLLYFIGAVIIGIAFKKFFNKSSDKFMEKAEKSEFIL